TLYESADFSVEEIQQTLRNKDEIEISLGEIEEVLNPKSSDFISEIEYRKREYRYLIDSDNYEEDTSLVIDVQEDHDFDQFYIKKILQLKRLKLTSVQTGYSRQEPIDKDLFAEFTMDDFIKINRHTVKPKYTSTKGKATKILPAVESYGEGIFIEFEQQRLASWIAKASNHDSFNKRIEKIKENALHSEYRLSEEKMKMINSVSYLAKFIFIHTFSHILIKELEFLTGYPATSLSERLYVDNSDMQGVLIYTIAGAEGSYGGLVAQAESSRFIKILNSALQRAKDCTSDPVCYHSDGQGVGGLNLAACYSCCLLPETSCEEFNSYLDRGLLIGDEFGVYYSK
ncbi:MAG: DUF1998 domain-containing protein, partial [Bacteroidota bacterium]